MPTNVDYLISTNRDQKVSESDTFTEERYRQMHRHFPKNVIRILDMGCNTGRGGVVLREINPKYHITGLDCVPERLDHLDSTVYSGKICGFSNDIQRPDQSFDAILGGEFIEHIPPVQVGPTLCEFFRLLRLKGRLLLTTPNPHYLKNRFRGLSVLLDDSHATQHYPKALRQRLLQIGFSNIKIVGSGRLTRRLGENFPWLSAYGSYLITADKW